MYRYISTRFASTNLQHLPFSFYQLLSSIFFSLSSTMTVLLSCFSLSVSFSASCSRFIVSIFLFSHTTFSTSSRCSRTILGYIESHSYTCTRTRASTHDCSTDSPLGVPVKQTHTRLRRWHEYMGCVSKVLSLQITLSRLPADGNFNWIQVRAKKFCRFLVNSEQLAFRRILSTSKV